MKLLVVDDHPIVRDGLAVTFRSLGPDTVVLQAGAASEAFAAVAEHPDLDAVLLDLGLPDKTGFSALAEIGRLRPECPVIVVSASEDPRDVREALAKGAMGYVPKSAAPQTLLSALRLVLSGDLYVPPLILTEESRGPPQSAAAGGTLRGGLTDRQIEVLRRIAEGQPNKIIASDLGLSEKTVKAHVTAIFRALDVISRTQAVTAARSAGLI
jgi:two-component system, NarL family, nitrate/nitrite response regulator NarL